MTLIDVAFQHIAPTGAFTPVGPAAGVKATVPTVVPRFFPLIVSAEPMGPVFVFGVNPAIEGFVDGGVGFAGWLCNVTRAICDPLATRKLI